MLEPNPARRATIDDVLQHPWVTMDISAKLEEVLGDPTWLRTKHNAQLSPGGGSGGAPGFALAQDSDSEDDEISEAQANVYSYAERGLTPEPAAAFHRSF